jgi:hypothetical protein
MYASLEVVGQAEAAAARVAAGWLGPAARCRTAAAWGCGRVAGAARDPAGGAGWGPAWAPAVVYVPADRLRYAAVAAANAAAAGPPGEAWLIQAQSRVPGESAEVRREGVVVCELLAVPAGGVLPGAAAAAGQPPAAQTDAKAAQKDAKAAQADAKAAQKDDESGDTGEDNEDDGSDEKAAAENSTEEAAAGDAAGTMDGGRDRRDKGRDHRDQRDRRDRRDKGRDHRDKGRDYRDKGRDHRDGPPTLTPAEQLGRVLATLCDPARVGDWGRALDAEAQLREAAAKQLDGARPERNPGGGAGPRPPPVLARLDGAGVTAQAAAAFPASGFVPGVGQVGAGPGLVGLAAGRLIPVLPGPSPPACAPQAAGLAALCAAAALRAPLAPAALRGELRGEGNGRGEGCGGALRAAGRRLDRALAAAAAAGDAALAFPLGLVGEVPPEEAATTLRRDAALARGERRFYYSPDLRRPGPARTGGGEEDPAIEWLGRAAEPAPDEGPA